MKILGRILFVVGIVLIIPAVLNLARDLSSAGKYKRAMADLEAQRSDVRERLGAVNLEFRGYQQSVPSIPDSVKMANSGKISEKLREYSKTIRTFEMQERDLTARIKRQNRLKEDALSGTFRVSGGLGGPGMLLVVAGLVLWRRGR